MRRRIVPVKIDEMEQPSLFRAQSKVSHQLNDDPFAQ